MMQEHFGNSKSIKLNKKGRLILKKVFTIILMMFLVIGLSSCQNNQDQMTNEDTSILVAYY